MGAIREILPLPGKSHGWRSLVDCSPWGRKESDTTERLYFHFSLSCIGEGNGNPFQCSSLENLRDRGAWLAVIYGVAQSDSNSPDLPGGPVAKTPRSQWRRPRFHFWSGNQNATTKSLQAATKSSHAATKDVSHHNKDGRSPVPQLRSQCNQPNKYITHIKKQMRT